VWYFAQGPVIWLLIIFLATFAPALAAFPASLAAALPVFMMAFPAALAAFLIFFATGLGIAPLGFVFGGCCFLYRRFGGAIPGGSGATSGGSCRFSRRKTAIKITMMPPMIQYVEVAMVGFFIRYWIKKMLRSNFGRLFFAPKQK
jgi:hypothetical protein